MDDKTHELEIALATQRDVILDVLAYSYNRTILYVHEIGILTTLLAFYKQDAERLANELSTLTCDNTNCDHCRVARQLLAAHEAGPEKETHG